VNQANGYLRAPKELYSMMNGDHLSIAQFDGPKDGDNTTDPGFGPVWLGIKWILEEGLKSIDFVKIHQDLEKQNQELKTESQKLKTESQELKNKNQKIGKVVQELETESKELKRENKELEIESQKLKKVIQKARDALLAANKHLHPTLLLLSDTWEKMEENKPAT
jgi:hypothetical protein